MRGSTSCRDVAHCFATVHVGCGAGSLKLNHYRCGNQGQELFGWPRVACWLVISCLATAGSYGISSSTTSTVIQLHSIYHCHCRWTAYMTISNCGIWLNTDVESRLFTRLVTHCRGGLIVGLRCSWCKPMQEQEETISHVRCANQA